MKLRVQCDIPSEYLKTLEANCDTLFVAPVDKLDRIGELLDEWYNLDPTLEEAKRLLKEIEAEYGASVFTVRIATKIDTMENWGIG